VAGIYTNPHCAAPHLVQAGLALDLTSPVQEDGVTLFRFTLYVRVPLDERCQGLVAAPISKLQVRFDPTTVQVTRGDSAWVTKWHEEDAQHVTVQLTYPAPIVRVHSDIYGKVALHRVDGDAVSEKPTIDDASTGQTLPEAFVASAFQAAFSGPIPQAINKVVQDKLKAQQTHTFQSLSAGAVQGESISGDSAYDDMKLAAIMESALGRLDLSGKPTTPRLRLLSADQSESLWQWLEPGEHAGPISYSAQGSDLGDQLQPALDRALALREGGEMQMVLPLLVESDAPCRVTLQQANLEFQLQADLLSEPAQLSFAGGSEQTQLVSLETPEVQPVRLQLQASIALRDQQTAGEPGALADGRTGVQMEPGMQAAALWEADRPYWLIGIAVAWYGLSEHAALHVSLLPEAGGPATATGSLADASLDASAIGPAWLRFLWPQVPLQPGRYWLRLQVEEGSGLWLGEGGEEFQPLWQQTPPSSDSVTSVPLSLLHFALEPAGAEQAQPVPVRLKLNGIELAASSPRADALAAESDAPAALTADSPWALEASSASDLSVTFQSALLTYQV
jgi:hypothetical protein